MRLDGGGHLQRDPRRRRRAGDVAAGDGGENPQPDQGEAGPGAEADRGRQLINHEA